MAEVEVDAFSITYTGKGRVKELETTIDVSLPFDPNRGKPEDHPKLSTFGAIWDTGATNTCISDKVAKAIGLKPIDAREMFTASGSRISNVYLANIYLPNNVVFYNLEVTDAELGNCDVLIGMDIIAMGDFAVTAHSGDTKMSFQTPGHVDIDFVETIKAINKENAKREQQRKRRIARNRKPRGKGRRK